jgi:hypothetical protein
MLLPEGNGTVNINSCYTGAGEAKSGSIARAPGLSLLIRCWYQSVRFIAWAWLSWMADFSSTTGMHQKRWQQLSL